MTALKTMRSNLTARKGMLETQIQDLDARVKEKQQRVGAENGQKEHPANLK